MSSDPSPSKRYASAAKPVNSRTASARPNPVAERRTVAPAALPPGLRDRLARLAAQKRLGPGLLQSVTPGGVRTPLSAGVVGSALGGTGAGVAAILWALRGDGLEAGAASVVGLGLSATAWLLRHSGRATTGSGAADILAIDEASLRAFDEACARIAPALKADALVALRGIKASLTRMVPLLSTAQIDGHFTQDDLLYTVELVRRYLPDTLQAYLAVPAVQRAHATRDAESADSMLVAQLGLLQTELNEREARLGHMRAGALAQQGRFLEAKRQAR